VEGGIQNKNPALRAGVFLLSGLPPVIRGGGIQNKNPALRAGVFLLGLPPVIRGGGIQKSPFRFAKYGFICDRNFKHACMPVTKKAVHKVQGFFVGVAGFEPATPWSQTRCANRTALYPE
jgi:hypothetical protein